GGLTPASNNGARDMRKADRLQDHLSYPPRAMRAEHAAAYLSMSRSMFLQLVEEGTMPPPVRIKGMVTWDRLDLDAAYENFRASSENTVARRLRELRQADSHSSGSQVTSKD